MPVWHLGNAMFAVRLYAASFHVPCRALVVAVVMCVLVAIRCTDGTGAGVHGGEGGMCGSLTCLLTYLLTNLLTHLLYSRLASGGDDVPGAPGAPHGRPAAVGRGAADGDGRGP